MNYEQASKVKMARAPYGVRVIARADVQPIPPKKISTIREKLELGRVHALENRRINSVKVTLPVVKFLKG